jgi:flagellar hook-associated protein FlgK
MRDFEVSSTSTGTSAPRRWLSCAALVVAIALLVAACGGSDKDAYETGMRGVGAQISKASSAVADLPNDATNAQRIAAIRAQQSAIADAADSAGKLDPPSDASKDHKNLVSALQDYATLLGKLADSSGNAAQQTKLLGQAGAIVKRLSTASGNLEKLGYSFGLASTGTTSAATTTTG